MDANETRFHMLAGERDWLPALERAWADEPEMTLEWDRAAGAVALARRLFRFERSPSDAPPALGRRRGAAVDRYGNWYWISGDGDAIYTLSPGHAAPQLYWPLPDENRSAPSAGRFSPVEPPQPKEVLPLRGLAVTEEHYLAAGTLAPAGLVIFDLHAGGPPLWVAWPEEIEFSPYDMAAGPGGSLYILDREHRRYWILDRTFRAVPVDQERVEIEPSHGFHFHPESGPERRPRLARAFPRGISLEHAAGVEAERPVAIEALPDGTALILDAADGGARVLRYAGGRLAGVAPLAGVFEDEPFEAFDFAFLPASSTEGPAAGDGAGALAGALYVVGADGNQSFAFALRAGAVGPHGGSSPPGSGVDLELVLEMRYLPMRSFGGRGLVAVRTVCGEGAVYYDREERGAVAWSELVEKPRPRFAPSGALPEVGTPVASGGFEALAFDGKERGCVWHRVLMDAVIPKGTGIAVETRVADELDLLASAPWRRQPDPYLRPAGAEIPFYRPFGNRGCEGAGTWELLLQEAKGRYLQLRIALQANGRTTPRLSALRVYYPRFSYLKEYLPAAYREDPVSASFLERFLANPEGIFTALEDRIHHAHILFDPRTVPAEYLEWLAGWLGLSLEASWDERRKRLLIRHAARMFAERGTKAGIIRAIRLATDPCPSDAIFADPVPDECGAGECATGGRGSEGAAAGSAGGYAAWGVRIVEQFLTRRSPGVVFGDPSEAAGPGVTSPLAPWSPDQGPEPLHRRYREYLAGRYGEIGALNRDWGTSYASFDQIEFPPVSPESPVQAEAWLTFTRTEIGFTYAAVDKSDEEAYRRFLEQRYRRPSALAAASAYYAALGVSTFAAVRLPERLPPAGTALSDWIQFASIYLPALERAHRFTVLVPVLGEVEGAAPGESCGCGSGCGCGGARRRLAVGPDPEVVRRIVELEKPAHTAFEVKPYWAMFRVGEARLGIDTLPGRSGRLAAAVVGRGDLGEQYLAYGRPWNIRERMVAGRDRLTG